MTVFVLNEKGNKDPAALIYVRATCLKSAAVTLKRVYGLDPADVQLVDSYKHIPCQRDKRYVYIGD